MSGKSIADQRPANKTCFHVRAADVLARAIVPSKFDTCPVLFMTDWISFDPTQDGFDIRYSTSAVQ